MNNLLVKEAKIIGFGNVQKTETEQQLIENYSKPWPIENDIRLPKGLCWWDESVQEVKAKTQAMKDQEKQEEIKKIRELIILNTLPEFLLDCEINNLTWPDFLAKIKALII